jgi:hypothetical protein
MDFLNEKNKGIVISIILEIYTIYELLSQDF